MTGNIIKILQGALKATRPSIWLLQELRRRRIVSMMKPNDSPTKNLNDASGSEKDYTPHQKKLRWMLEEYKKNGLPPRPPPPPAPRPEWSLRMRSLFPE